MSDSVELKVGDVVVLKSGGPAMTLGRPAPGEHGAEEGKRFVVHYAENLRREGEYGLLESPFYWGALWETELPLEALAPISSSPKKDLTTMVKFEGHHAAEKGLVNVEVGSLVRLNSGSAVMTVVEVFKVCGGNNLADVVVTFFVGDEPKGFSYVLPLSSVTLVG